MELKNLLQEHQVIFNLKSTNKEDALVEMAQAFKSDVISDFDSFIKKIFEREGLGHTQLEGIVATPHAKSAAVLKPAILIAKSKEGIDFSEGEEEKAKIFFMIAVPESEANLHIDILVKISDVILDDAKVQDLLNADTYEKVLKVLDEKEEIKEEVKINEEDYVLAVTACPTGIAHTFMARDALVKAAKEMGVKIKVETNGTDGRVNEITKADLEKAKGVILAVNKAVDEERFNGYKVIKVSAKDGINKSKELIQNILDGNASVAKFEKTVNKENEMKKSNVYDHLMSGVSYMLPLVISGGILIALAFLIDSLMGNSNAQGDFGQVSYLARTFKTIGVAAFGLFVPILAGYISYSVAGKSALSAGLVAGALASSGGSGFLGALVGGLFAGYFTKIYFNLFEKRFNKLKSINLILFTPVITVFVTGLAMLLMLNPVVSVVNNSLNDFLGNMNSSSKVILGLILGAMMSVDMGGPVNKAAYLFGTGTLATSVTSGGTSAMAAVMAGGMVPPLAIALSTTIFKNRYSKDEREAGISNYIMGLSFITEGAIPFAAANPIRVIPACVIGSSIAGALTMLFDVKIPAPHGGILVMFLSNKFFMYLLAILIGSLIAAILLAIFKKKD